jgi:hypothetical protein
MHRGDVPPHRHGLCTPAHVLICATRLAVSGSVPLLQTGKCASPSMSLILRTAGTSSTMISQGCGRDDQEGREALAIGPQLSKAGLPVVARRIERSLVVHKHLRRSISGYHGEITRMRMSTKCKAWSAEGRSV